MIHPRVLFYGDPAATTPWVGIAKKLARECYLLKISSKVYRLGSGIQIRVENIFPIADNQNGISKIWINGGGTYYGFILLPRRLGTADYGWEYKEEQWTPLEEDVNYYHYQFLIDNNYDVPNSFFGIRYINNNSKPIKVIPWQPLLAGNQFVVRQNDSKIRDVYSYWGSPYGDLSIGTISSTMVYAPFVRRVNRDGTVFYRYSIRTPKSLETPFPEYPVPIWLVYKNGTKFIDIGGPNNAVVGLGLFSSSLENPIHKNKLIVINQYGQIRVYSEQGELLQIIETGIKRGNYTDCGSDSATIDGHVYQYYVEYVIDADNLFSGYEWKFSENGKEAALIKIDPIDSILVYISETIVEFRPIATLLYKLTITENDDEDQTLSASTQVTRYKIEDTEYSWSEEFTRWQYGNSLILQAPYEEAMFSRGGQLFLTEEEAIAYGQSIAAELIAEQPPENWLLEDSYNKSYELSYPYAVNYRGNNLLIAWITLSKEFNKDYDYYSARDTSSVTTNGIKINSTQWDHRNLFTVTQPATGTSTSIGVYKWTWTVKFEDGTIDEDSPVIPLLESTITEQGDSDYSYESIWTYDPTPGYYNDKTQQQQTNSSFIRDVKTGAFRFAQLSWKFYLWNEYLSEDSLSGTYLYRTHIRAGSILEDFSDHTTERRETTDVGLSCFTKLPNLESAKIHETDKNVEDYPIQFPYYDVSIFPVNGAYSSAYDYVPGVRTLQRPYGPVHAALDRRSSFLPYILEEAIVASESVPFTCLTLRSNLNGFTEKINSALAPVGGYTNLDRFGPIGLY